MKSVCFCLNQPPGLLANEIVDLISVLAVFDLPITVVFQTEGVWQLFDRNESGQIKNTTKYLSALPTYGVSDMWVEQESLADHRLLERFQNAQEEAIDEASIYSQLKLKDRQTIVERIRQADMVIGD